MTKKCIIISQPRTGSTLLTSLLTSPKGSRIIVEPINPKNHRHHMRAVDGSQTLVPQHLLENIGEVLDILFDTQPPQIIKNKKLGNVLCGFKIMIHQINALNHEAFWEYIAAHRINIITCFRNNLLEQYVSDMITKITKQSACWDGKTKTGKITFNINEFSNWHNITLTERKQTIDLITKLKLPQFNMIYEDFKYDFSVVSKLWHNLTGISTNLSTTLAKQNPDSMKAKVNNYDYMVQELSKIQLESYLTEV